MIENFILFSEITLVLNTLIQIKSNKKIQLNRIFYMNSSFAFYISCTHLISLNFSSVS